MDTASRDDTEASCTLGVGSAAGPLSFSVAVVGGSTDELVGCSSSFADAWDVRTESDTFLNLACEKRAVSSTGALAAANSRLLRWAESDGCVFCVISKMDAFVLDGTAACEALGTAAGLAS